MTGKKKQMPEEIETRQKITIMDIEEVVKNFEKYFVHYSTTKTIPLKIIKEILCSYRDHVAKLPNKYADLNVAKNRPTILRRVLIKKCLNIEEPDSGMKKEFSGFKKQINQTLHELMFKKEKHKSLNPKGLILKKSKQSRNAGEGETANYFVSTKIPEKSPSEVSESERIANGEDETKRAVERRWQYIQRHPIKRIEILFILKETVGYNWFREILDNTRLTFSQNETFKLGQLLSDSSVPNSKEPSRALDQSVCSFWEIYEPEAGYWFKKIAPTVREFSTVAGFDAVASWSILGVQRVSKLEDLALLTEIGVSIPARAYHVGVEEFELGFIGDTFSFSIRLSEQGLLGALHEFAHTQYTTVKNEKTMPLGTSFSGVQLLDMFFRQLLPRLKNEKSKHGIGRMGLSGPDGKAISFYPTMPRGFNESQESKEYSFTITVPPKIDSASRIEKLEKKYRTKSTDANLYGELASLYEQEGRLKDAMRCLETAFKRATPMGELHGLMAQILMKVGRFDEAYTHLKKAETLAPANAIVQNKLGICLDNLGKDDEALIHFESAVRIEPSNSGYQFNYGWALIGLRRFSAAMGALKRSIDLAPNNFQSLILLAILLDNDGRLAEATSYFERAIQIAPDTAEAHKHLGIHLARANQHEKAVKRLQRAIDIKEDAELYELLGTSFARLEKWVEAETAFRQGLRLDPNHSGILANLGVVVAMTGRFSEAIELWEQSLRFNPNNKIAKNNLIKMKSIINNEIYR